MALLSFHGAPTLSVLRYIGKRHLAGLIFLKENDGFA
jgi:hypothetical protein